MAEIVRITRVEEVEELLEASNEQRGVDLQAQPALSHLQRTLEQFQDVCGKPVADGEFRLVEIQNARPVSARWKRPLESSISRLNAFC